MMLPILIPLIDVESWRPARWLRRHWTAGGRALARRLEAVRP
jgi:hypothetical protein